MGMLYSNPSGIGWLLPKSSGTILNNPAANIEKNIKPMTASKTKLAIPARNAPTARHHSFLNKRMMKTGSCKSNTKAVMPARTSPHTVDSAPTNSEATSNSTVASGNTHQ